MINIFTVTQTMTPINKLPTFSPSPTIPPTETKTSTETLYVSPTMRPTPTNGIPPTATRAPREICPSPTHAKIQIQFVEDDIQYGPQILQYLSASGDPTGLKTQLNKLGRTDEGGTFITDKVYLSVQDVTGDGSPDVILLIVQLSDPEVAATYGTPPAETAVFVVACQDQKYALLYQYNSHLFGPLPIPLRSPI